MSDTSKVTTLALLNLIRLLAAELVAGEHRDDCTKLIEAMDRQLTATPLPRGIDVNDARAGIEDARKLLRPYIKHVRDQAQAVRARDQAAQLEGNQVSTALPRSKFLQ
ncbi:hypothetical protein QA640_34615 [Bradyrhizobium sp. CB82]|uniref:hypothetical protein n=1 Tax=Bradyrhizobium sp. CB82 TaxID=3039159 RepID=UPI0024B1B141|nr:hypothetical protein [Bradyrhizobium sp. CB82]WFU39455.1 hypothetical protein QA640_34615 [Bradyrhizobium sp. CB82]